MPYKIIKKSNGRYKLVLKKNNKVLAKDSTLSNVMKQMRAIELNKMKRK